MSGSSVVRKHTQIGMYRSIENKQKLGWLLQNGHNWLPSGSDFFDTSLCLWTSNIQYSCLEARRISIMLTPNNQYMSTPEWDLTSKLVQPPIIDGYIIFISACPHSCLVKCTSRWYLRYYDPITVWSNGYVWKLVINTPSYGYLNRKNRLLTNQVVGILTQIAVPICNPKNGDIFVFIPRKCSDESPLKRSSISTWNIPSPSIQRWRVSLCHRHVRDRPPHLVRRGDCMKIPGIFMTFPRNIYKYDQDWSGMIKYPIFLYIYILLPFSPRTLPTDFPSVHIVGSLTSNRPSIIYLITLSTRNEDSPNLVGVHPTQIFNCYPNTMSPLWLGYPKWHPNGIVSGPLRLLSEELMKNIRVPHSFGVKMGHHVPSHWTGKSTLGNHIPNKILKIDNYWYLWYLGYILHTHLIYPK